MTELVAVYVDREGHTWHVCVFPRDSVGAWRSNGLGAGTHLATVVFERPGEERVASTDSLEDWSTTENLERLFLHATDRRGGDDRRIGERRVLDSPIRTDSRSGSDRRGEDRRRRGRGRRPDGPMRS